MSLVLRAERDQDRVVIGAKYLAILDAIVNPRSLNSHLYRIVQACVGHSESFVSFSIGSDKAQVCGLALDAGALVFPDNHCTVAVPQVARPIRPHQFFLIRHTAAGL